MSQLRYFTDVDAISRAMYAQDTRNVWIAIVVSIALHALMIMWYPHLNTVREFVLPKRVEIELLPPVIDTVPTPPLTPVPPTPKGEQTEVITPAQPKQEVKPLLKTEPRPATPAPVLTAQASSPIQEYVVPAQPVSVQSSVPNVETSTQQVTDQVAAYGKPEGQVGADQANISSSSEMATSDEAWDGYGQQLYELVNKGKNYPAIAVRRNWEGDVKIIAKFVQGQLISVAITELSGHQPLDDEAMRMVKKAITQLEIKGALAKKSFTVTIPVSFRLDQG